MPRATRKAALQVIPEDEEVAPVQVEGSAEVLALIDELERKVEEKVHAILATATQAVFQLKAEFTRQLVHIPKKTREMPLSQFKALYPDDFQTGALAQIGQKFAALKEEMAAKAVPTTNSRATRTAAKRAAEPETVLRTTRRKVAAQAPAPKFREPAAAAAAEPAEAAPQTTRRGRGAAAAAAATAEPGPASQAAAAAASRPNFMGRPLQTPMPFAGEALPAAVTLLTQKRGGRTKGAASTDAAVITTSDGQQWAVGKQGLASIPETHRQEVQELLTAQFEFFAAALGRTVMTRRR